MLLSVCLLISLSVFLYTYLSICKPIVRIVIVRIPIPKFNFLLMLLTCRRASENVDCYPKNGPKICYVCIRGKSLLYIFLRKQSRHFLFFLCPGQKPFCPLWGITIIKKFISNILKKSFCRFFGN